MAEVILSEELEIGDVFFDPRHRAINSQLAWWNGVGLRRVIEFRTFTIAGGSYRVLKYVVLDTIAAGQLDLRTDVAMARVRPVTSDEAHLELARLTGSDWLTVWSAEGRLWI
jgi:hypothetical protein